MDHHPDAYRLLRRPTPPASPPRLDAAQQAVVDHAGGPLLVLAGPGTGKTTAIVEAVAQRITERRIDPERVLVLTFSRKAAQELRERITTRLRRTTRQPLALTFHSYAYALVRREFVLAGDVPPTLLSGPEQLLEVRRMLRSEAAGAEAAGAGAVGAGAAGGAPRAAHRWPERLRPALGTRGFATELRDFLLRGAERGLDGRGLARLGRAHGREDWVAAGAFLDRYIARFDLAPVPAYDYAEIVRIAAALLSRAATRDRERKAYDVVLVDEYQDTDPAQEALLHALAGDGRELIAVGDPDQSIYAFRGADVHAMGRFPDLFRTPDDRPASVVALRTCRRSGPVLLAASRRVAARLPAAAGLSVPDEPPSPRRPAAPPASSPGHGHRDLLALASAEPGSIRIMVASSASQEAAVIADTLRRAHLVDGIPWSSMAVLVRSATRQVPLLRRALATGGVPAVVAGDELPLAAEPGARPLLALLRCALQPGVLDEDAAAELLTGPLGGTDAVGLRRLRRWLHAADAAAGLPPGNQPLASALRDPRQLNLVSGAPAAAARRVATLLELARRTAQGATSSAGPRTGSPAPPTTCCGRSGTRPGSALRGRRRARPEEPVARPPTGIWTRWSPCLTRRPGSRPGCRPAHPPSSWRAWAARRSPATAWPTAPPRARRSASSPRTAPRAWNGTWSWWPGSRRAPGPTCGCGPRCWAWTSWSTRWTRRPGPARTRRATWRPRR